MKKLLAVGLTAMMMATALTGCGNGNGNTEQKTSQESKTYTIGVNQFAQHGSLDNCYDGFVQGLAEEGIIEGENLKIELQNANADSGTAGQIATNFVQQKVDLLCGIATPSAMAMYNAGKKTDIPVIYTAVTDPIAAELASENGTPVGEVTGTSDKLAVEAQLKMIRELLPDARKIGIMYTTSEVNSLSAIKEYEAAAEEYGFEIITQGVSATADVPMAADNILTKVDCLNNLTDNTVVSSLPTILDKAEKAKIPVFGSEIEQVKKGCLAAEGLDYVALGVQTGKMAAQVLKGEKKANEIPFETITESGLYLNKKVAETLDLDVADIEKTAVETFDEITE